MPKLPTPSIDRIWGWTNLARLGNNKLVRSSYLWFILVPIAAKTLDHLPPQITLHLWGNDYVFNTGLPFSWILFFAGAASFTIATTTFGLFCPNIISRYKSFSDFKQAGNQSLSLILHAQAIARLPHYRSSNFTTQPINAWVNDFCDRYTKTIPGTFPIDNDRRRPMNRLRRSVVTSEHMNDAFTHIRQSASWRRREARAICGTFYFLGMMCWTVVAVQNVIFVADHALNRTPPHGSLNSPADE